MRHEIRNSEAEAIREARAQPIESFRKDVYSPWDTSALADAAATGNREAAEKLQEIHDLDEAEARAGTQ